VKEDEYGINSVYMYMYANGKMILLKLVQERGEMGNEGEWWKK
jgi:hypothetical protein